MLRDPAKGLRYPPETYREQDAHRKPVTAHRGFPIAA
jgi:hypothetical protein